MGSRNLIEPGELLQRLGCFDRSASGGVNLTGRLELDEDFGGQAVTGNPIAQIEWCPELSSQGFDCRVSRFLAATQTKQGGRENAETHQLEHAVGGF